MLVYIIMNYSNEQKDAINKVDLAQEELNNVFSTLVPVVDGLKNKIQASKLKDNAKNNLMKVRRVRNDPARTHMDMKESIYKPMETYYDLTKKINQSLKTEQRNPTVDDVKNLVNGIGNVKRALEQISSDEYLNNFAVRSIKTLKPGMFNGAKSNKLALKADFDQIKKGVSSLTIKLMKVQNEFIYHRSDNKNNNRRLERVTPALLQCFNDQPEFRYTSNLQGGSSGCTSKRLLVGGKKTDGDRHFRICKLNGKEVTLGGVSISNKASPRDAAKKLLGSIAHEKGLKKMNKLKLKEKYVIQEYTQGSAKKMYGPYHGYYRKYTAAEMKKSKTAGGKVKFTMEAVVKLVK